MNIHELLKRVEELEEGLSEVRDGAHEVSRELSDHRKAATITIRIAKDKETTLTGLSEYDEDEEEAPFYEETFRLNEHTTRSTSVGDRDVVVSVRDVEWGGE